jgi:hypothetical protein
MEEKEKRQSLTPEVHPFPARNFTLNNFLPTGHPCTVQILASTPSKRYFNHLRLGVPVWQRTCNCGFRSHESSPRRLL